MADPGCAEETRAWIAVRWAVENDVVYAAAAEKFHLHPQTVRRKALEMGIRRGSGRRPRAEARSPQAVEYARAQGISWSAAARRFGIQRQAVSEAARRRGDRRGDRRPSPTECWWIAFGAVWTAIGCAYALRCVLQSTSPHKEKQDAGHAG